MATTALVLALLGLAVSAWAAWNSHRSRQIAEAADRRASTPRLVTTVEGDLGGGGFRVRLRSLDRDLDQVVVGLMKDATGTDPEAPPVLSVTAGGQLPAGQQQGAIDLGALPMSGSTTFAVWTTGLDEQVLGKPLRLRCECRVGKASWTIPVSTEFPPPPPTVW